MTKATTTPPAPRTGHPKPAPKSTPPEGPHARPGLIDEEKTPGSGMFPTPGTKKTEPPAG
jgi:hypothetical protein